MYIYSNACDDCKITLKTLSVPVMQLTNTVMFLIGRIGIVIAVICSHLIINYYYGRLAALIYLRGAAWHLYTAVFVADEDI